MTNKKNVSEHRLYEYGVYNSYQLIFDGVSVYYENEQNWRTHNRLPMDYCSRIILWLCPTYAAKVITGTGISPFWNNLVIHLGSQDDVGKIR